jgi:hypothetical protein
MTLGKISLAIVFIAFLASCSSQRISEKSTQNVSAASASINTSNTTQQQNSTQPAAADANARKVSKYKTVAE